jgi:hypothetical protein
MLKMCRKASVRRNSRPLVFLNYRSAFTGVHHRFNRKDHAGLNPWSPPSFTEIGNLGILMKISPNPVTDELTDNREAI